MEKAFYLFSNLFHIYAVYQGSNVFFQKDSRSVKKEILCYFCYYLLNSGTYLLFHNGILNILSNLIPFFCITLLYKTNWMQRIFATVSIYIISMIVDILCISVSMWIHPQPIFFTTGFVSSLVILVVSRILQHRKPFQKDRSSKMQLVYLLTTIFVPFGSIIVGHFVAHNLSLHSLISAIILLMININVFTLHDYLLDMIEKRHTAELIEKQNIAYQVQLNLVQQSQLRLRCLRHDMNNHLFQMQRLLNDGQIEQLHEYLSTTKSYLHMDTWVAYTQNEAINSILNFKLSSLRQEGVELHIKVKLSNSFSFEVFDINVILGNLLDNAIEALERIAEVAKKKIVLSILEEKGIFKLYIGNRFDGILPANQQTRKSDVEHHGLGTRSIQEVIQKYQGKMQTNVKNEWYEVTLLLYKNAYVETEFPIKQKKLRSIGILQH